MQVEIGNLMTRRHRPVGIHYGGQAATSADDFQRGRLQRGRFRPHAALLNLRAMLEPTGPVHRASLKWNAADTCRGRHRIRRGNGPASFTGDKVIGGPKAYYRSD